MNVLQVSYEAQQRDGFHRTEERHHSAWHHHRSSFARYIYIYIYIYIYVFAPLFLASFKTKISITCFLQVFLLVVQVMQMSVVVSSSVVQVSDHASQCVEVLIARI